jgi:methylated-DNA-[protein]-cysteine S-methyltransferase
MVALLDADGCLVRLGFFPQQVRDSDLADVQWDAARGRAIEQQLTEYFAGSRTRFELCLKPHGTPFQQRVWSALQEVPFGQTISYQTLSDRLGNPAATRAVGRANGANPIPIVIPCHRIVGSDGTLTGYAGGLQFKVGLLRVEGVAVTASPIPRLHTGQLALLELPHPDA